MKDSVDYNYVSGLKYEWLTKIYDPLIKMFFDEDRLRAQFIRMAVIQDDEKLLDIGCGTGTLTVKIKSLYPFTRVVGIDGDAKMLVKAKQKAEKERVTIDFRQSLAEKLPFSGNEFDKVVSTLVFHHLPTRIKKATIQEIKRVLKPGGKFLLSDWGKPNSLPERALFYPVQILDGFETTTDNVLGNLLQFIRDEFHNGEEIFREKTWLGVLSVYQAMKIKQ